VIRRQLGLATSRGWDAAAGKLIQAAEDAIRDVPYYAAEAETAIKRANPAAVQLGDIMGELEQAQSEFGHLKYTPQGPKLSIVTEPIELEDVYLGEFEIELDLSRLAETRHGSTYSIIALDPHPASSNDAVTHPHVSDSHLCEGDASAAIAAALATGRIFDFFMLVKGVLTTYNASSPYISLSDWSGVSCHECGCSTDPDELHFCNSCESDFCGECISYCRACDESTCRSCLEECGACGDMICPSCKTSCPECGRTICVGCKEEEQCPCVQERKEQEENDRNSDDQPAPNATGGKDSTDRTKAA
jgi:hypothetical protein